MSKKSATPARGPRQTATRAHRRQQTPAPAGLAAAFKLIQMDGFTSSAAAGHADEAYPHACRIIRHLHGELRPSDDNGVLIQTEIDEAARAMYSVIELGITDDPAENPHSVGFAGFHVGFAVCWLLMTAVNGNGGAR